MALIKKCDVKDYFAAKRLRSDQNAHTVSRVDAAGFSGDGPLSVESRRLEFSQDFIADHSLSTVLLRSSAGANSAKGGQQRAAIRKFQA